MTGVDASELGIEQARENARLNGLEDRVEFVCADVFDLLPKLEEEGKQYDVVILDPPAFTKSCKTIKNATKGYRDQYARNEAGKTRRISGNLFLLAFYGL